MEGEATAAAVSDAADRAAGADCCAGVDAAGFGALTSTSDPLRLPNTTVPHAKDYLARSLPSKGARKLVRGFLASPRPVSRCAICRNISDVRWLAEISAIIWPLLAAEPKKCRSPRKINIRRA